MRKLMNSLLIAAVSLGMTAGFVRGQPGAREELDSRAHSVNDLADRHGGMREAIHDVSVETGVPMDRVQRMHDEHPNAGAAGILIACVMADNTKEPAERFLERHQHGRSWASIARESNVPLDKINYKLDNLQRELGQMAPTGRDRYRQYQDNNRDNGNYNRDYTNRDYNRGY